MMVLGRIASNFVRPKRNENTPPKTKTTSWKATHSSFTTASRRRRARSNNTYDKPGSTDSARRRRTRTPPDSHLRLKPLATPPPSRPTTTDVEMVEEAPGAPNQAQPNQTIITLPRRLSRPAFRDIEQGALAAIDGELEDVPVQYIRDRLHATGPGLMSVLASTTTPPLTGDSLPNTMDAIVTDVSGSMPTHMMAVYSRPEAGEKCKVMVYPIHSIVLAAHCANLSALPPSKPNAPETPGAPVTIPVVPLCLPHAESFPILSTYLYSKRPTNLLSALLPPAPRDPNQQPIDKTSAASMTKALRERAVAIGSAHSPNVLVERCARVSGLWHNVCALGVYDDVLWRTMDVAWETLLFALGVSIRGARALVDRS